MSLANTCPHRDVDVSGVRIEKERTPDGGAIRYAYEIGNCRACHRRVLRRTPLRASSSAWVDYPDRDPASTALPARSA